MLTGKAHDLVPVEIIERRIYLIRGHKVMLDSDLASLYGVAAKRLNEQVKRSLSRFPDDFMFQLTKEEANSLRSQIATSNTGRGGRRYRPYAFTEHGVAMLSSVLNSQRAVHVNIVIIRAFVKLREALATHKDLAREMEALKRTQQKPGRASCCLHRCHQSALGGTKASQAPHRICTSRGIRAGREVGYYSRRLIRTGRLHTG